MSYRPKQKIDSQGTILDLPLDAETVKGVDVVNTKTNTSVIPNNNGEIKTKYRCSVKGYTGSGSPVHYYKLLTLPTNNDGNYASAIINGRIGGWTSGSMSSMYCLAWNRGTPGFALFDIGGTGSMSDIFNLCDLVMYVESNNKAVIYAKVKSYFTFDFDIEVFQSTATIDFDGTYITTTPTGTLTAQTSTSTSRMQLEKGVLKVNGTAVSMNGHNHDSSYLGKTAKATDSSKLNGQEASYYLNYNNFTNTPTIPDTTYMVTTNTTQTITGNKIFSGTTTLGTASLGYTTLEDDLNCNSYSINGIYELKFDNGEYIGSDLEFCYDSTDAHFIDVGVANNDFVFTYVTHNNIQYPELKFTRSNTTTTYGFTADGIYFNNTLLPTTDTNYYHTPSYSTGLKIGTGTGVNDLYIPTGNTASSVCLGNDSRLSDSRTPKSHTHGNITNDGKITSTAVTSATGVLVYDSNNAIQRATAAQTRSIIGAGTSNLTIGTTSTTAAAGNHAHGNITNGGDITATGVTIASGDALVIRDSSASKLAKTSITFDGSTTTKFLSQKGTWESAGGGKKLHRVRFYKQGYMDISLFCYSNSSAQTDAWEIIDMIAEYSGEASMMWVNGWFRMTTSSETNIRYGFPTSVTAAYWMEDEEEGIDDPYVQIGGYYQSNISSNYDKGVYSPDILSVTGISKYFVGNYSDFTITDTIINQ